MTTTLYSRTAVLETTWCGVCGVDFAVPDWLLAKCRENGREFWCPSCGKSLHFTETEVDRLRKEKERLEARLTSTRDQRDAAERATSAQKGQVTRLKNRAKAGACPCCNRTFVQLSKHMQTRHPDFKP